MFIPLPAKTSNVIAITTIPTKTKVPSYLLPDIKKFANYFSVKIASLTIIVFPSSGHINITGITSFTQIPDTSQLLNDVFQTKTKPKLNIVSSTSTGKIVHTRQLRYRNHPTIWQNIAKIASQKYTISFQRGVFPSVIIRNISRLNPKWSGCIQIFNTGKYNIIGCKSKKAIKNAIASLTYLLSLFYNNYLNTVHLRNK